METGWMKGKITSRNEKMKGKKKKKSFLINNYSRRVER